MYTIMPYRRHHEIASPMFNDLFNDRFFRSFFNMDDMVGSAGFRVDVKDSGNAYVLEAELPGVRQEDINLSVDNDALTISADINAEKKEEKDTYLYSERRSGHVSRTFSLEGVDQDQISAAYQDGVLKVNLPKAKPEEPRSARRIAIAGAPDTEEKPAE